MESVKKMCFLVVALLVSGCVLSKDPSPSLGSKILQNQAIAAYENGVAYMGQGRYLLARKQFSEAVSMAVTQGLYNDAMAGMTKADAILQNRRMYHE